MTWICEFGSAKDTNELNTWTSLMRHHPQISTSVIPRSRVDSTRYLLGTSEDKLLFRTNAQTRKHIFQFDDRSRSWSRISSRRVARVKRSWSSANCQGSIWRMEMFNPSIRCGTKNSFPCLQFLKTKIGTLFHKNQLEESVFIK